MIRKQYHIKKYYQDTLVACIDISFLFPKNDWLPLSFHIPGAYTFVMGHANYQVNNKRMWFNYSISHDYYNQVYFHGFLRQVEI